jgi:PAS domain S-box-containing protein
MLDPTGHVVSWNKGAERIKGYRAAEIIGQHFSRFYPAADRAAEKPATGLRIAAADGRYEEDGWRVRKDGTLMWANVLITALRDGNRTLIGFAKVTRDVSDKKRIAERQAAQTHALERAYAELEQNRQELKLANEDLEGFTYSVSHDLRAPIHHIGGFARLLLEEYGTSLSQGARDYVVRIQERVRHMRQLVDDLLNLSHVGRQGLRIQACPMGALVRKIAFALRAELAPRDVRVVLGRLPVIRCDPGLARVVFTNLLSNAFKFTREIAHAVVDVGVIVKEGQPVFYVRDNGVGFDPKYADRLFGVFQRFHPEFEGSGIGLATVQRIIHKHGGQVWAESLPSQGTTFYFTFGAQHTSAHAAAHAV